MGDEEPTKHMRLDIVRRDGSLSGEVGVDGETTKRFTGWIGLNAAIEHLLGDDEMGLRSDATQRNAGEELRP